MDQPISDGQLDPESVIVVGPALVVRPGDRLIIGVLGSLSMEQADRIRTHLLHKLPGLADVVLVTQVTQLAAYREQDDR